MRSLLTLPMLMIRPRFFMWRAASCAATKTPLTFTAMSRSNSASLKFVYGREGCDTRVVDQDVEAAEGLHRCGNGVAHRFGIGAVGADCQCVAREFIEMLRTQPTVQTDDRLALVGNFFNP